MKGIITRMVKLATIPARSYGKQIAHSQYEGFIKRAQAMKDGRSLKVTFRKESPDKVGVRVVAMRSAIKSRHLEKKTTHRPACQ